MACACGARKNSRGEIEEQDALGGVHTTLPNESCIFCAYKHFGTAAQLLIVDRSKVDAIGELELARRHTQLEYPDVALSFAQLEFDLIFDNKSWVDSYNAADKLVEAAVDKARDLPQDAKTRAPISFELPRYTRNDNPLQGLVHLCAAYRMATEVGYLLANRDLIVGDLTLATQHLVHTYPDVALAVRELRHRVESTRSADLDPYWPHALSLIYQHIMDFKGSFELSYSDDLKKYLRIDTGDSAPNKEKA